MMAAQADAERIKVGEHFNLCILHYSKTSYTCRWFLVAGCNTFVLSCSLARQTITAVHPISPPMNVNGYQGIDREPSLFLSLASVVL